MSEINNNKAKDAESRILKAAEHEFMQKGFAGARTTNIADAAGVSHSMLHYYFRTKERLFKRIITDKISTIVSSFTLDFGDEDMNISESLENGISRHFDYLRENPDLPRFIINVIFPDKKLLALLRKDFYAIWINTSTILQSKIDKGAYEGLCKKVDARSLLFDIVSLNVNSVLALPFINEFSGTSNKLNSTEFLNRRKKHNIEMILGRLKN